MQGRIWERSDRKKKNTRENKAMLVFRYNTPLGIELSLSTAIPQPALRCYNTHSGSPHTLWQGRKMTYSLLHFYWPFHPRYPDTVKRESTSIWPYPGTPLKDKTTTIRLHFPASCCPHSSGYVHSNPIFKPLHICIHTISFYQECRSLRDMWISQRVRTLWVRAWKTPETAEALLEGDRIRLNISIKRTGDDHKINPAFGVRAAGGNNSSPFNPLKKRAPQT